MEALFLLKKKFGSGRVIRNIYEYMDTRKYWLKRYRDVIHNGTSLNAVDYLDDDVINEGIKSAFLRWTPYSRIISLRPDHLRHRQGSRSLRLTDICEVVSRFQSGGVTTGNLLFLLKGKQYLNVPYITPLSMEHYTRQALLDNCIENNIKDIQFFYFKNLRQQKIPRNKLISLLMSI